MERQFLLDISNYQQYLNDFAAVARDGFAGCIILASDGDWRQPYFREQLARARAAGLLVAAYHYQRENVTARRQVEIIAQWVPRDVPVIIDVEHHSGRGSLGVQMTRTIIADLRARGYTVPLVYIPRWYWASPADAPKGGLGYADLTGLPPLWISWYPDYLTRTKEKGADMLPPSVWTGYGGLHVALAQFTSSGRVSGYGGPVDQNVFRGTRAELAQALGYHVPITTEKKRKAKAMAIYLVHLDTGEYALLEGGYVTGVDAESAKASREKWGVPEIGVTDGQWRDFIGKSERIVALTHVMGEVRDELRLLRGSEAASDSALLAAVSERNQDGLRGGAAAPDGVGGPTEGDPTGNDDNRE